MNTDQNDIDHQATVEGLAQFTCHKNVHQKPMTLEEYHHYHHDQCDIHRMAVPQEKSESGLIEEGYLVVYEIGQLTEYRSWSPKASFDDGYTVTPKTAKERLLIESLSLSGNINKLGVFINEGEVFGSLPSDARTLMIEQLEVMKAYSAILGKRVSFF